MLYVENKSTFKGEWKQLNQCRLHARALFTHYAPDHLHQLLLLPLGHLWCPAQGLPAEYLLSTSNQLYKLIQTYCSTFSLKIVARFCFQACLSVPYKQGQNLAGHLTHITACFCNPAVSLLRPSGGETKSCHVVASKSHVLVVILARSYNMAHVAGL